MTKIRDYVCKKICTIAEKYHLSPADGNIKGTYFPVHLTLSALTCILDSTHFVVGDPGWGKTTSMQVMASMFSGIPLDVYQALMIKGHPGLYEEKIVGRPDYAALNNGIEEVIWQGGLMLPVLLMDEVRHIPMETQSCLLEGIRTGIWTYLNGVLDEGRKPTFFSSNDWGEYENGETENLKRALEDRMSVVTEQNASSVLYDFEKAEESVKELMNPEAKERLLGLLKKKKHQQFKDEIRRLSEKKFELKEYIRESVLQVPISNPARYFLWAFASEINYTQKYGVKRARDPVSDSTHDKQYAVVNVRSSFSPRSIRAAENYARGLAWILGEEEVELDHVRFVIPHVSAHKLGFTNDFRNAPENSNEREDYEDLHCAKRLVERVYENYQKCIEPMKDAIAKIQRIRKGVSLETLKFEGPAQEELKKTLEKALEKEEIDFREELKEYDHPFIRHLIMTQVAKKPFF